MNRYSPLPQVDSCKPLMETEEGEIKREGETTLPVSNGTILIIICTSLIVVVICSALTMKEVSRTVALLQPHLDFIDTRKLPRPDHYCGQESLFDPI